MKSLRPRKHKTSKARIVCASLGLLNLLACPALADTAYPNWNGPYVGVHGGGIFSDYSNGGTAGPDGSDSSLIGGVQAGANWQYQRFVLGGEADVSKIDLISHNGTATFGEDYMATFRGRAGYAINQFLPYVTAGLGLTDAISKAPGQGEDSRLQPGLVLGAGVDTALTQSWLSNWTHNGNWVGRIEYLHVDVPKENDTVGATTVNGGSSNNIIRVGLNYKF